MSDAFFTLHADLPREGPGLPGDVVWATGVAGVPPDARMLDAGCGPGADIDALLQAAPRGRVVAVDRHLPFVHAVNDHWGYVPRVTARHADMGDEEGPFDFVWIAGALYFLGIEAGLQAMRGKLAPGACLAFSELVWLVANPSPDLVATLGADYPEMAGRNRLGRRIAAAGYDLLAQKVLPDAAWEAYYTPMERRIRTLRIGAEPDLADVLDQHQAEIDLWRANRLSFGYALSVVRPLAA